jgi:hypothetical protein
MILPVRFPSADFRGCNRKGMPPRNWHSSEWRSETALETALGTALGTALYDTARHKNSPAQ